MKALRYLLASGSIVASVGCSVDTGPFLPDRPPIAYVRYLNAVADTGLVDIRPVDGVQNSPPAIGLQFRSFTPYQAMGAGPRRMRLFPALANPDLVPNSIDIVSKIVLDSTVTFAAEKYYTVVYYGLARPGQAPEDKFLVLEDQVPATIGTQVAVRAVNLLTGIGAVDVYSAADATTSTMASFAANVPLATASPYVLVSTGARALRAFPAGTSTTAIASVLAPAGAAADPTLNLTAVGGSGQAGSAITAFFVPRSVAGSSAPQGAAFTTATIVWLVDKHPR